MVFAGMLHLLCADGPVPKKYTAVKLPEWLSEFFPSVAFEEIV